MEFSNSQLENKKLYYDNGSLKYEGTYLNDKRHGYGILYYPSKKILFKGNFVNGIREGYGECYFENGFNMFKGEFKNNLPNGMIYFPAGDKYKGDLLIDNDSKDMKFDGFGTLYKSNGHCYKGNFKDNKFYGYGEYYLDHLKKNLHLVGMWTGDNMTGPGVIYHINGNKQIEGNFKVIRGKIILDGEVNTFNKNGTIKMSGLFNNNNPVGDIKLYENLYVNYEGELKVITYRNDNAPGECVYEGKGKVYYPNSKNIQFIGNFKNGLANGRGIYFYKSGRKKHEGEFHNNASIGEGIAYNDDNANSILRKGYFNTTRG